MNLNRPLGPVAAPLAAAALSAAASGLAVFAARAVTKRRVRVLWRNSTGGCTPDNSPYVDGRVCVHEIDGTHQGYALSALRDRFLPASLSALPEELAQLDRAEGEWADGHDYDDALRSCVEVAINLALNIAEEDCEMGCTCGEDDCDAGEVNYEVLHLVAGQKMTAFALSFTNGGRAHAAECVECESAGVHAPAFLRAQFCRDIADDLLTNFSSEDTALDGLPVPAAVDVLCAMIQVLEKAHEVSPEASLDRMTAGLAAAIGHKEEHEAQQS